MTPDFKIIAAGVDISAKIQQRLLELQVKDEAGLKSDAVDIKLDDRDSALALPATGTSLEIHMGYKETGLVAMGLYTADEITLSGPPQIMTIRAKAADLGGSIKNQKSREWSEITICDLVETIAAEHGLTPKIAKTLGDFIYKGVTQTDESDISFLNRLSKHHDALVSVKNGALLFISKGMGVNASGKALSVTNIHERQVTSWQVTLAARDAAKSVTAKWHNKETGKTEVFTDGEGSPAKTLRHTFGTKEEAERAAKAALSKQKRAGDKLSVTIAGDSTISAEGQVNLIGFRKGVSGRWSVRSVQHTLNDGGFQTKIEAEIPKN